MPIQGGAGGGPRRRAWAVLDRSPGLAKPGELPDGVDYAITHNAPPNLSTLFVTRPPLPLAGDDGDLDDRIHCADADGDLDARVHCADADGDLNARIHCADADGDLDVRIHCADADGDLDARIHCANADGDLDARIYCADADGDLDARIHCADADGNLLVSVWGPGTGSHALLVCRHGSGRMDMLPEPEFPKDLGELEFGPGAPCTGILPVAADPGPSVHYLVAQLQRVEVVEDPPASSPQRCTSSSSSSSSVAASPFRERERALARAHHRALIFSSTSRSWSIADVVTDYPRHFEAHSDDEDDVTIVEEVAGEQEFEPHTVVSNDHALVFIDLNNGLLLLLDPAAPATARMLSLPASSEEDGGMEEAAAGMEEAAARRRCVASSEGGLCVVQISMDGSVSMFYLEHEQWVRRFRVAGQQIIWGDPALALRLVTAAGAGLGVGPVDPTNRNRLTFFSPATGVALMVEVDPGKSSARFCAKGDVTSGGSCLDVVACRFDAADPAATAGAQSSWKQRLKGDSKQLGRKAWHAFEIGRKHVEKLQPVAQAAGALAAWGGVPYAPLAVGAVAGLVVAHKVASVGEEFVEWWMKETPPPLNTRIIGDLEEAAQVIHEWVVLDKPSMIVYPAPGLSKQESVDLGNFMVLNDAEELLPVPIGSDYVDVSTAFQDFSSV